MKKFTILIATVAILSGCTSTNSGNDIAVSTSNVSTAETALNGQQIRKLIVGNTIVGRGNNFPKVGPIDFWVHYDSSGAANDRLKFARGGKVDRATGTWRITDEEQGIFCGKFAKRRKGAETCAKFYVTNDQFRTEPTDPGRNGVTGKIVIGDQVQ